MEGILVLAVAGALWFSGLIPPVATAMLIPVLSVMLGISDVKSAFSEFSHPVIFLFMSGFVFAGAFEKYGISKLIAEKLVESSKGSFLRLSISVFVATLLFSAFMSNTSACALMLPFVRGLIRNSERKNAKFLLLGLAYSSSIGGTATLIGTPPNAIAGGILGLSFSEWMRFALPYTVILFATAVITLYIMVSPTHTKTKPDTKTKKDKLHTGDKPSETEIHVEAKHILKPWKKKALIFVFVSVCILWIAGKEIGEKIGVEKWFDSVVGMTGVLLLLSLRIISPRDFARSVSWGTVILFGGGLTLSKVLKESGGGEIISQAVVGVLSGVHPFLLLFCVLLFVVFMTELMSNTALSALILPLLHSLSAELGFGAKELLIPSAVASSCAFMLPIATPPNAIVFGTGFISQKEMMKVGFVLNLIAVVEISAVTYLFLGHLPF